MKNASISDEVKQIPAVVASVFMKRFSENVTWLAVNRGFGKVQYG
jgi:hypothetical protein